MSRPVIDQNNNHYRKRFRGVNEPVQSAHEFDERNVSDWNNRNSFRDHTNGGVIPVANREYPSQNRHNVPEDYRNYSRDK